MPASTWPLVTLVTTALTLVSSDFGWAFTPAVAIAWAPYFPHGTSTAQSTKVIPGLARSVSDRIFLGFPFFTRMASLLWAKTFGLVALPGSVTFFMLGWSAEANRSAGAPLSACVAKLDEAS